METAERKNCPLTGRHLEQTQVLGLAMVVVLISCQPIMICKRADGQYIILLLFFCFRFFASHETQQFYYNNNSNKWQCLTIVSFNVGGLNCHYKRSKILDFLHRKKIL